MGRAPCCDKAAVKRGPWSPEEDTKLKDYIHQYGTGGNWIALPHKAGLKRCGKSCRLRWLNYLRPNIKHGEFTEEEDRVIYSLYASIGSRWSIIAAQLPGRTDNDIKNYWNTKLKKKLMAMTNSQSQKKPPPVPFPSLPPSSSMYKVPFQPISSLQYDLLNNTFLQGANSSVFNHTTVPESYYPVKEKYLMFGSADQQSCSSSDGSCNQISYGNREIKQEDMSNNFQGFPGSEYGYDQDSQKFMLSYGDHQNVISQWSDHQKPSSGGYHGETPLEEYDLEDVKRLINSSSNNINNCCNNYYY